MSERSAINPVAERKMMPTFTTVDGHDFGSGEFNIFILTDDPATVFGKAQAIVMNQGVPNVMRSAYREMDREDYVILWPSSLTEFSVL